MLQPLAFLFSFFILYSQLAKKSWIVRTICIQLAGKSSSGKLVAVCLGIMKMPGLNLTEEALENCSHGRNCLQSNGAKMQLWVKSQTPSLSILQFDI